MPPKRKCQFVESDVEVSGEDSGDESEAPEEETEADKAFRDDGEVKARKLPRLRKRDLELDEDDYALVKESIVGVCYASPERKRKRVRRGGKKRAYADADDLDDVRSSDLDCISFDGSSEDDSSGDDAASKAAEKRLELYRKSQGLVLTKEPVSSKEQWHQARQAKTLELLRQSMCKPKASAKKPAGPGHCKPPAAAASKARTPAAPSKVKPFVENRQPAAVFDKSKWAKLLGKPAKPPRQGREQYEGLVVNPKTKEVHFQTRDGKRVAKPGLL